MYMRGVLKMTGKGIVALAAAAIMHFVLCAEGQSGMKSLRVSFPAAFTCTLHTCGSGYCVVGKNEGQRREVSKKRNHAWKEWLTAKYGMSWPEGSSVALDESNINEHGFAGVYIVTITNTQDEILKFVEKREEDANPLTHMVALDVCVVEAGYDALAAAGIDARIPKEDVSAEFAKLLARKDASVFSRVTLASKSGQEVTAKSVVIYRYPQDFDVTNPSTVLPSSNAPAVLPVVSTNDTSLSVGSSAPSMPCASVCGSSVVSVEPQNFETEEVGTSATATMEFERGMLDVHLELKVKGEPKWKDYGMTLPSPYGGKYQVKMEQPFFDERIGIDTHLRLTPGMTFAIIGAPSGKEKKPLTLFLTPHLIGAPPALPMPGTAPGK